MRVRLSATAMVAALPLLIATAQADNSSDRRWLAGDHHVHSRYSGKFREGVYQLGADGIYPMAKNAEMAQSFGLTWMVAIDHGGPGLSKMRFEQTWPELQAARQAVPRVIQFYGMELDTPGGDHSTLMMALTPDERADLRSLEQTYAADEVNDPARDTTANMLRALNDMKALSNPPAVFANHPSRSAKGLTDYHGHTPQELRNWNDTAPNVAIGMEGAPGHQGTSLKPGVTPQTLRKRGYYEKSPTFGGFDAMTARVGGVWDSFLGEGRRFWITATSDSHRNIEDGGEDFWPGQYAKTYVLARPEAADIMRSLRAGHIFVTTGDLISELQVDLAGAGIGDTAAIKRGQAITLKVRLRDPAGPNAHGDTPELKRVDLIMGDVTGKAAPTADRNPSTHVIKRFTAIDWKRDGEIITLSYSFKAEHDGYVRLRGTSTHELEPAEDPIGEDPWPDLWFYANPVFIDVK
jgi:hypothetical protein